MPRRAAGLTAANVKVAPIGRHGDGDGLYLLVRSDTVAFWIFRYTRNGRMREMGLGRARGNGKVDLADARQRVRELREIIRKGVDPLDQRDAGIEADKAAAQEAAVRAITFKTVAEGYIAVHQAGWRNAKHAAQWTSTLKAYVYPILGDVPIADVATEHVLAALHPIWSTKPETAARVRMRIENVLDYAKALKWRAGENPAIWRGHLVKLLPSRAKVAPVVHHAALPWTEIGQFMKLLRSQPGIGARALEFAILTAGRAGEVLGAAWGEMDLTAKTWTVPPSRMKARREHRVPLSEPAIALLGEMKKVQISEFVFPGASAGKPLSNMAMAMVLRRMKRADLTQHGFRSTFRDWAAETTSYSNEVAEAALAHIVSGKVEAAYRRGDLFEKRRGLMEEWCVYLSARN